MLDSIWSSLSPFHLEYWDSWHWQKPNVFHCTYCNALASPSVEVTRPQTSVDLQLKLLWLIILPRKGRAVLRMKYGSKTRYLDSQSGRGRKERTPQGPLISLSHSSNCCAPLPSSMDGQELAPRGWLHTVFLNCLPLMKDTFHQGKWHRGGAIFPETQN